MDAIRLTQWLGPDELTYTVSLAKKFTDQIGFLSTAALEHYAIIGGVIQAWENGQECAYIAGTHSKSDQPRLAQIYQAAVAMDLQRRQIGLELVREWELKALTRGAYGVQLWCAADIDANEFWAAAGYTAVGRRPGGRRRGREHILWQKALSGLFVPDSQKETHQEARQSVRKMLFDL